MAHRTVKPTCELGRQMVAREQAMGITREEAISRIGCRPQTYINWLASLFAGWIVFTVYSNLSDDIESIGTGLYVTGLGAFLTFFASLDMLKVASTPQVS